VYETGYDFFNDQFMLIPRQYSDYLYDLNTKATKKVYCLGGPDVEKWKCDRAVLKSKGVKELYINQTLYYCCEDTIKKVDYHLGDSEATHFRHLLEGKIPVSLTRFPVYLVRILTNNNVNICSPECFRIGMNSKQYLFMYDESIYKYIMPPIYPERRGEGINIRDMLLCHMINTEIHSWKPISALDISKNSPQKWKAYVHNLSNIASELHPSLLLQTKDRDAWRIRASFNSGYCISSVYKSKSIEWNHCNDHIPKARGYKFDSRQIFFLYVHPHGVDPIYPIQSSHTNLNLPKNVETILPDINGAWNTFLDPNNKLDNISHYIKSDNKLYSTTRIMTVLSAAYEHLFDYMSCITLSSTSINANVTLEPCSTNMELKTQLFIVVKGIMSGGHFMSTVGQIKLSTNPKFCLCRAKIRRNRSIDDLKYDDELRNDINHTIPLTVSRCDGDSNELHHTMFEFENMRYF
jgi:hypothetical protein